MVSQRAIGRMAGLFLLATVVSVVVAIATDPVPVDSAREDVPKVLREIAADRDLFIVSIAFDIFSNLLSIPLAAALYLTFRSHERSLALLGAFGFLASGVVLLTVDMVAIAADWLAQTYARGGSEAASALTSANAIVPLVDVAVPMGAVGIAIGVFSIGLLIAWTGALPRWMGAFGLVAGVVTPFGWLSLPFAGAGNAVLYIGLMIALFFSLVTGAWLVIRGVQPAAE